MVTAPGNDPDLTGLDESATDQLNEVDRKHFQQRSWAIVIAFGVIVGMALFEVMLVFFYKDVSTMGNSWVFLAIAPIASITIVASSVLIGAFSGNKDRKMIPLIEVAKMIRQSQSGSVD